MNDETTENTGRVKTGLRQPIFAWLVASIGVAILSSAASSYSNLSNLRDLGIDIPFSTLTEQMWTDFKGIGPLLMGFTALGMAAALPVAGIIHRKINILRPLVYIFAGMACLLTMFLMMEFAFFRTPIIQGARTAAGLFSQMMCGGVGGLIYARLTRPNSNV